MFKFDYREPKVIAEIGKKSFGNGMALATYSGVRKSSYVNGEIPEEIWFAIYMTNI